MKDIECSEMALLGTVSFRGVYLGENCSYTGRIIMIAVYRKYRYRDIDIRILIIDMIKCPTSISTLKVTPNTTPHHSHNSPGKLLTRITQHLQLTRLLPIAVHAKTPHDLVHRFARRFVLVEQIAGQENHVDFAFFGQTHDFVEGLPAVVAADGIALVEADVVVCCD